MEQEGMDQEGMDPGSKKKSKRGGRGERGGRGARGGRGGRGKKKPTSPGHDSVTIQDPFSDDVNQGPPRTTPPATPPGQAANWYGQVDYNKPVHPTPHPQATSPAPQHPGNGYPVHYRQPNPQQSYYNNQQRYDYRDGRTHEHHPRNDQPVPHGYNQYPQQSQSPANAQPPPPQQSMPPHAMPGVPKQLPIPPTSTPPVHPNQNPPPGHGYPPGYQVDYNKSAHPSSHPPHPQPTPPAPQHLANGYPVHYHQPTPQQSYYANQQRYDYRDGRTHEHHPRNDQSVSPGYNQYPQQSQSPANAQPPPPPQSMPPHAMPGVPKPIPPPSTPPVHPNQNPSSGHGYPPGYQVDYNKPIHPSTHPQPTPPAPQHSGNGYPVHYRQPNPQQSYYANQQRYDYRDGRTHEHHPRNDQSVSPGYNQYPQQSQSPANSQPPPQSMPPHTMPGAPKQLPIPSTPTPPVHPNQTPAPVHGYPPGYGQSHNSNYYSSGPGGEPQHLHQPPHPQAQSPYSHPMSRTGQFTPRSPADRGMYPSQPPPLSHGKVPGGSAAPSPLPPNLYGPNRDQFAPNQGQQQPGPPPPHSMFQQQMMRKELTFPPGTVEAIQPVIIKRRRINARDLGQVDSSRLMMALKSGLLAESTWALDVLSVLFHDDNAFFHHGLQHIPGLLDTLLEHYKKYLTEIFEGLFDVEGLNEDGAHVIEDGVSSVIKYKAKKKLDKLNNWYKLDSIENVQSSLKKCDTYDVKEKAQVKVNNIPKVVQPVEVPRHNNHGQSQVLLNGNLNFTMKSRDGKPVKIVPPKDDLDLSDVENQWHVMNEGFTKNDEQWDNTCHIMTNFTMKDKPLRFARILKSNSSTKDAAEKEPSDTVLNCKEENEGKEVKVEEDSSEEYPRFREPRKRKHDVFDELEEEAYHKDEPPLCAVEEYCDALARRCICLSTLIRNFSFVAAKEHEMSKHEGLLLILSRLMLLNHDHPEKKRSPLKKSFETKESLFNEDLKPVDDNNNNDKLIGEDEELESGSNEWYWNAIHLLLENSLVTLANISGQLDVSPFPEYVSLPLLDGLLHWAVCPSSYSQDQMPTTSVPTLSPQRMALEALVKMSILDSNVDLILATPPWQRLDMMFKHLTKLLSRNEDQTLREFSLVLLVNLSKADSSIVRAVALTGSAIPQLVSFVEQAEQSAMNVAHVHGIKALRDQPELMGTTLNMVNRAAQCLRNLSRVPENRPLFLNFQQRLLGLVMSPILDQEVAAIIADIIYECSLSDPVISMPESFLPVYRPPTPLSTAPKKNLQSEKPEEFKVSNGEELPKPLMNGHIEPEATDSKDVPSRVVPMAMKLQNEQHAPQNTTIELVKSHPPNPLEMMQEMNRSDSKACPRLKELLLSFSPSPRSFDSLGNGTTSATEADQVS